MKRRFSVKTFILVTLIHLAATWLVFDQGERAYAEWKQTGAEVHSVWLSVTAWALQPVALCVLHSPRLVRYFPWHKPSGGFDAPNPTYYILPWTVFVGICFGFLGPCIWRWRRRDLITGNH